MAKEKMIKIKKDPLENYTVAASPQSPEDKRKILSDVPHNHRVMVKQENGKARYKQVHDILDSDTILFKRSNGKVVKMKGRPGRLSEGRKELEAKNDTVREVNLRRKEYLEIDKLARTARRNYDSPDLLQEVVVRMAEVASSLSFERDEAQRNGKETSIIARRELSALIAIRDASLKRIDQRLRKQEIDLESIAFRNLFVCLVKTFAESMAAEGYSDEQIESVIAKLSKAVDSEEWKASAVKSIQGSSMIH